jgi:hypothetical protein
MRNGNGNPGNPSSPVIDQFCLARGFLRFSVSLQRDLVGMRHFGLGDADACGWAACNACFAEEFGNCRFVLDLRHGYSRDVGAIVMRDKAQVLTKD